DHVRVHPGGGTRRHPYRWLAPSRVAARTLAEPAEVVEMVAPYRLSSPSSRSPLPCPTSWPPRRRRAQESGAKTGIPRTSLHRYQVDGAVHAEAMARPQLVRT